MTITRTAGSIRTGDRILDPSTSQPATVVSTIPGAPLIGLILRADHPPAGSVSPYQRVLSLTTPVTLA
jgi:hypothetical protein